MKSSFTSSMESDYCIVPCPKYSVEQEHYYSMTSWQSAMMCIPKTNVDAESSAAVLDYMAYLSLYDVWPNYLKKTIESKGTRDEESIDMINIIRDTITIDAGFVYSWTQDLFNQISDKMSAGDANIASVVASQKAAVDAKIDQFLEAIE